MINYNELIRDSIDKTLSDISWACEDCLHVRICEDDNNIDRGPLYCWPIIEAAILGRREWEYQKKKTE